MPGIKEFLVELKDNIRQDNVPVAAAGIAFFGFFALFPALTALISVYGLVADPNDVVSQLEDSLAAAPEAMRTFLIDQAEREASASGGAQTAKVVFGILLAVWSSSAAIKHLIAALNRVYGFRETRGFLALRGASYLFTLGAVLVMSVALFGLAVLPGLLAALDLGTAGRILIGIVRFPGLVLFMTGALSILYFLGPDRPSGHRFRWVTAGSLIATVMWVALSGVLSIYFANLDSGAGVTAIVGVLTALMIFLQITSLSVLVGAEIDATREKLLRRRVTEESERTARLAAAAMTPRGRSTLAGALVGTAVGAALGRRDR